MASHSQRPRGRHWFGLAAFLSLAPLAAVQGQTAGESDEDPSTRNARQFYTQVRPLLAAHCWSCHSQVKQEGGLRLDSREGWKAGGFSKRNLLETNFENNELLRRLQAIDPHERMPLARAPLSEEDRRVIEVWLQNGATWTDAPVAPSTSGKFLRQPLKTSKEQFWLWLEAVVDYDLSYLHPIFYAGIGYFFILLVLEWCYERAKKRGVAAPAMLGIAGLAAHLRPYAYLIPILGLIIAGLFIHYGRTLKELASVKDQLVSARRAAPVSAPAGGGTAARGSAPAADVASSRPPFLRPKAPFKFGGTYYRGNDERNEQLYNGGYYRTATLKLALCDMQRNEIALGDELPEGGLQIRVIIIRGRNAAASLFSRQLMSRTIITSTPPQQSGSGTFPGENFLEEVRTGEEWHAYLPLPKEGPIARTGDAYLVSGNFDGMQQFSGAAHYLIHYDLKQRENRLAPDSELWLAATLFPGNVVWTPTNQITASEWFDFLPIPEIEGPNTTDPKLLGLPEHEKRLGEKLDKQPAEASAAQPGSTSNESSPPSPNP